MTAIRHALRRLLVTPGFLVVAVLTLALGVGSVSAVFSVVDATMLKPLPYPDSERIIRLHRVQQHWGGPVSAPVLDDWRQGTQEVFAAVGAFTDTSLNLTGSGDAERLSGLRVTPEFWSIMALPAQIGRYFGNEEERSNERVVVLSHRLWQRRFDADTDVIGRDLMLNGESHRVIGVTPAAFRYPGDTEVYVPTYLPAEQRSRGSNFLSVLARLHPETTLAQAETVLAAVNERLGEQYPNENAGLGARMTPLHDLLNSRVRQPLLILFAASALVLLIACANLANLLLARGHRRAGELALRSALGAPRRRLLGSLLAESGLLAVLGTATGILLAFAAIPLLLAAASDVLPAHSRPALDLRVLALSATAGIATVLFFSLWPALRASSVAPVAALQEDGRSGGGGHRRSRARSALVVVEVALSLVLLVGAGLLIESLRQLARVDTGLSTGSVLTAAVTIEPIAPIPGEEISDTYRRHTRALAPRLDVLLERVAALPGVEQLGLSDALPLSGIDNISSNVTIVGREVDTEAPQPYAHWRFVSPDFFAALGMRIVQGRGLAAADQRPGSQPRHILVNQTFVRRFLADVDPIGRELSFFGIEPEPLLIVGVVSDTRLHGVERDAAPEVYMSHGNATQSQFHLALKVQGEPMAYAEPLRRVLREIDPNMPVFEVRSMDQMVEATLGLRRFHMHLMTVFSVVALLLATIGLYGVIACATAERRKEFGVRMSLGANRWRLLGLVLRQGLALVAIGIVVGVVGAWALGRTMASQLFGVAGFEPVVVALISLVLALAALVACLLPALRAARIDPIIALRSH